MVRVKICGIKRLEDAQLAVQYGADALGFLVGRVHASPDFISANTAKSIIAKLPPFCSTVLVTHLEDAEDILRIARQTRCSTLQLHGDVKPRIAQIIRQGLPYLKIYKALHANEPKIFDLAEAWRNKVDALILDTAARETDQVGGTGKTHDWTISARVVISSPVPVILAGGLTPENVQTAIKLVQPYAVDVNSGTKDATGYKDPEKVRRFIEAARR
jgi:phosphoribosylanthranilate isomerase